MRAREIAETLLNGNISAARTAIVSGRSQHETAVVTLEVLEELFEGCSDGTDIAMMIEKLHRCLVPYRTDWCSACGGVWHGVDDCPYTPVAGVDYTEACCQVCGSADTDMTKHVACMEACTPSPPRGYPHHDEDDDA